MTSFRELKAERDSWISQAHDPKDLLVIGYTIKLCDRAEALLASTETLDN